MRTSVGMAVEITEENRHRIAIVNGGVVPEMEAVKTYFFFPYNYDHHCRILAADVFFETYRFANDADPYAFVDVDEL